MCEQSGVDTTFLVSLGPMNVISRNAVKIHFPDIKFCTRTTFDLYSDKTVEELQTMDEPRLHMGRFIGYGMSMHCIMLNGHHDLVIWHRVCTRFSRPFGCPHDFEHEQLIAHASTAHLKGCEQLFDEMPLLEEEVDTDAA